MTQENVNRYVEAQETSYAKALSEIRKGRKQTHWMWFIFPQIAGLGYSITSIYYAIKNVAEAKEYLKHPVLGARLVEICTALLELETNDAYKVFGTPDNLKLASSITLFSEIEGADPVFKKVLDKFFNGTKDKQTLSIMGKG